MQAHSTVFDACTTQQVSLTQRVKACRHQRLVLGHVSAQYRGKNGRHSCCHVYGAPCRSWTGGWRLRCSRNDSICKAMLLGSWAGARRVAACLPGNESGQGGRGGVVKSDGGRQLHTEAGGQLVPQLDGTCSRDVDGCFKCMKSGVDWDAATSRLCAAPAQAHPASQRLPP